MAVAIAMLLALPMAYDALPMRALLLPLLPFTDGFETGNFSAWSSADSHWTIEDNCDSGHWHSGSCDSGHWHANAHAGRYAASVTNVGDHQYRNLTKAISTAGFQNITLSFYYKIVQALESSDNVFVQWSSDGGETWTNELANYTDVGTGGWTLASFNLGSGANNNAHFAFRFRAYNLSSHDEFWIDDVTLGGDAITPSPSPTVSPSPSVTPSPDVSPSPSISPSPSASPSPSPSPDVSPSPSPDISPSPSPDISPSPSPDISPSPSPEVSASPEVSPEVSPTTQPESSPVAVVGGGNAGTATITVTKTVVNDGGGTKTVDDFPLFVDGFRVQSGVSFTVTGYYHTVSETNGYGYTAVFGGQCDAGGTVTTNPGDAKSCTITNDDPGKVLGVETQASPEPSPVPSPTGQVLGVTTECTAPYLTEYLKMGWNNNPDQVKKLQEYLNLELVSDGVSLPVTGVFGSQTFAAVKLLQAKYIDSILGPWGIHDPTGFVYITTQWFINTHMGCPNLPLSQLQ